VLPFGLESSVFRLPILSTKINKYRTVGLVLLYMTSHMKGGGGSQAEDFHERGDEEKTFGPKKSGSKTELVKST